MPCNTLHIFIEEIRNAVKIPVLSIVEETASFIHRQGLGKVGILATKTTLKSGMYDSALKRFGIKPILPDDADQDKMGDVIRRAILNQRDRTDKQMLIEVMDRLADKGADGVILACTDLQLLVQRHDKLKTYDTMKILAESTVREILK
jgi:aspartate racemase